MLTKKHWLVLGVYISMLLLTAVVPVILYFGFNIDFLQAASFTNVIGFLIGVIVILFIMKNELADERLSHPISTGRIIGWSALGVLLAWVSQAIAVTIEIELLGIAPSSENTEIIVEMTRMNPIFLLIPALLAPIIEELIFRKIIFRALYKKMNFFFAAILSSVIFGVLHMDFVHLLIYVTMGLVFAYLYVKTKRIIVPIIVHMTLNTVTVLTQLLIDPAELERMQQELLLIFFGG